jgi:cytoskeletal protein RodZ
MDIGGELRAARQARGISIDDVSRVTKVSPSLLRAIEENAFDTIPGGVFTRGYLRAYARQVGLDPDALVQRYRDEFEPPPPAQDGNGEPIASDSRVAAPDVSDDSAGTGQSQMLQIAVILFVAVAYLVSLRPPRPAAEVAPAPAAVAAAAPASASTDIPIGTSGSTSAPKSELAIEMQPHGPCWVDATVDGEHAVARLMNAGDRESITLRDHLTLRVGDPAAFAFTIDGVPGRSLGYEGHPVTVQITRQNYASFLARSQ